MSDIIIRQLQPTEKDTEDFRHIRLEALAKDGNAFGASYEEVVDRPLSFFEKTLSSANILGAYEGDKIVGIIGFRKEVGAKDAHKGWIFTFYIDASQRGKGLGVAMFEKAIECARGQVEQLKIAVWTENKSAIGLYEKFGFKAYGVEPKSLKCKGEYFDEMLMVLFL